MKNAIILHGYVSKAEYLDDSYPSASNSHWVPWLQKQLLMNGIKADTPEIPRVFEMRYDSWVCEMERFPMSENTTLVGHSMGGGFIVRYLTERPELRVDKVVLVAPWLNLTHQIESDFFDFELRAGITEQANSFTIFSSDNDASEIHDSVDLLRRTLTDVEIKEFHNYGHFCYRDLKTDAFPELLEECLNT